jgi:transposase-like protein
MSQHFLLSAKSRTISELEVARMSEDEARVTFEKLRWSDTDGKPVCSNCGCTESYVINTRTPSGKPIKRYKCSACRKQYTVTSGTIFASHKLELRDYLLAIIIFVNAVKGISASQMSRALGCQYKTAFVLIHKLRASLMDNQDDTTLEGIVEMDGCYIGKTKPANRKEDRVDLRLASNANPNKRCIIVARQRAEDDTNFSGAVATKTFITKNENTFAINKIATSHIVKNATIHVDGASAYDDLSAWFDVKVGDHSKAYVGEDGECSNQAESYFSRFRRLEYGQCHHISPLYLSNYANEIAYREDNRRLSNKTLMLDIAEKCMNTPTHNEWCGYWQGNKRVAERLVA